jgi:tetratricopeptide (TPR) repeat protein
MGQLGKAKKAYARVVQEHAQHLVAAQALTDLLQIAQIEGDTAGRVEVWKKLAFQIKRSAGVETLCRDASTQLASYYFAEAAFDEGVQALATTFAPAELPGQIAAHLAAALRQMAAGAETRQKADNLASRAVAYLRQQSPAGATFAAQQESLRQTLYAVADVHAAAQQDAKVVEVYAEIASRCSPSDDTLARLAGWQETKGKFDEAAKTYRGFAKKVDGLERLAASCRRRQRYDAAVATYLEILPLDATRKTAWMAEIAATYREARKYKEAIDVYQQLVAANPSEAGKWLDQIALTYRYARQFAEAVATYRELLKVDPANTPNWLWQMAWTHRDAGQWKEAIACYRQCTNFPDNYRAMAECHRRLGQYKEALMLYGQIVGDPAAAPGALLAIADTWEEAGKKEEAIKALQRVCKRCPKSPQASQAHARLQAVYKISITLGGATEE